MECTEVDEPAQRAAKLRESASPKTGCADWASPSSRCSDHLSPRNLYFAQFHSESRASHLVGGGAEAASAFRPPVLESRSGVLDTGRVSRKAHAGCVESHPLNGGIEFVDAVPKAFSGPTDPAAFLMTERRKAG